MDACNPVLYHSKSYWQEYVKACQLESGLSLKAQIKKEFLQTVTENKWSGLSYRPTYIYQTTYYPTFFSSFRNVTPHRTTVVIHQQSETPEQKKEREEKERADQAKVLGSILTVAGAGLAGYTFQLAQKQNQTIQETNKALENCNQITNNNSIKTKLNNFILIQKKVDQLNTSKINNYCIAAFCALISAATLAFGGFSARSWLITAGQIGLLVSTAFAALNMGMHWSDQETIRTNHELIVGNPTAQQKGLADAILEDLNKCKDDLTPSNPSEYQRAGSTTTSDVSPPPYESICPDH